MEPPPTWVAWRYLALHHLRAFLAVLGVVGFALFCIGLAEFARRNGNGAAPFLALAEMAALQIPTNLHRALPLAFMMGLIWSHARLSRQQALHVLRAAGFSPLRIAILPVGLAATIFALPYVAAWHPASALMNARLERLEMLHFQGISSLVALPAGEVWLRQPSAGRLSILHAARIRHDGLLTLDQPVLFELDESGDFSRQVNGREAVLRPGHWLFRDAEVRVIDASHPHLLPEAERRAFLRIGTTLAPEQILDSFASPESVPVWRIPEFIELMTQAGFESRRLQLLLQGLLSLPLVLTAMGLVGAFAGTVNSLAVRPTRVVAALLVGPGLYLLLYMVDTSILNGAEPLLLLHWGTALLALTVSAALLLYGETG